MRKKLICFALCVCLIGLAACTETYPKEAPGQTTQTEQAALQDVPPADIQTEQAPTQETQASQIGQTAYQIDFERTSKSIVQSDPQSIPEYSGEPFIILNNNIPMFNDYDVNNIVGQHFTELDALGRCGPAIAMIDRSMLPTEPRGSIGMVQPSGWHTVKYPEVIDDLYLYNRCHLIGYALTGENANELNLITGTRYLNITGMYSFESRVLYVLENTDNRVLYRVTPYFAGDELVARGVEMEAYSIEDAGASLYFHVFCYNVQPGIVIDYATGDSHPE